MKAVILAAGEGTRLRPLTLETPKPLILIKGRPILERIIESLPEEIDEVIMVVGHLKDKIQAHLGTSFLGKKISYVEQGKIKGTFGALFSAKDLLTSNERFLVLNADDLHNQNELRGFLKYPRAFGVQKMIMPNYYSVIISGDGYIEGFRAQTEEEKASGTQIATGVYLLDTQIFEHPGVSISGGEYGLPQTILAQKETHPITALPTTSWLPVNSFEDIESAEKNVTI
jgi:NDP-sugar pyrophosphorylase family protein